MESSVIALDYSSSGSGCLPVNARPSSTLHLELFFSLCVVVVPLLTPFFLSPASSLRVNMATEAVLVIGILHWVRSRVHGGAWGKFNHLVAATFALGTVVGLVNCLSGINSWGKWVEYSLASIFWTLAFLAGSRLSRIASAEGMQRLIILFALSEVVLIFPRLFVHGLDRRSPWGTTIWIGAILLVYMTNRDRRTAGASLLIMSVAVVAALLSGMRSSVVLSLLAMGTSLLFIVLRRQGGAMKLARFVAVLLVCTATVLLMPSKARYRILDKVSLVQHRFAMTLFHEKGYRLDEGHSGREREAARALEEFQRTRETLDGLVGFGHGFVFDDMDKRSSAHVHITPVAYYIRYGVAGIGLFSLLFVTSAYRLWRAWFERERKDTVNFQLSLTSSLLCGGALVAGFLVPITAWLTLGLAIGGISPREENSFSIASEKGV